MEGLQAPNFIALFALTLVAGMLPFLIVGVTSFAKIAVVLFIVRNALAIQQAPPNILLYGIALILTGYIMAPALTQVYTVVSDPQAKYQNFEDWQKIAGEASRPIRDFMTRNTVERDRQFFVQTSEKIWKDSTVPIPQSTDFVVLVPAFLSSELTKAFEIGFLLYLPFVMIDFAISAILVALGMQMMSPTVISTPLKLLLFVLVEGWLRLMQGLILSYV
ncbi:MAG: type III secretion system export apparatus subunit SctR [Pseudomonadota bacterium]